MEWIADPTAWLGLGTLILIEIVLGIDNLIFIAILVDRLPPSQRNLARIIGLSLALVMRIAMLAGISWLQSLASPVLHVLGHGLSVRDLVLIAGGLFLLLKATSELHSRLESEETAGARDQSGAGFWQAVVQIVILDFVFSIDSVVTAVGMVDHLSVMVIAVLVAIMAMMFVSGPLTSYVSAHPTVVVLALGFLLMIGFSLFAEGWDIKIPKEYLYAAIAFSVSIELLNQVAARNRVKQAVASNLRSRVANAVLNILGGAASPRQVQEDVPLLLAATTATSVFAPAERKMVGRVLNLAERPVRTIMTPAADVVWLEADGDAKAISSRIVQAGHVAYPVCRGGLRNLLGVARTHDLIRDLLQQGRIDLNTLEKPLAIAEDRPVLELMEKLRPTSVPMAVVRDQRGALNGVVTSTDLLQTILGLGDHNSDV
jgi:predicted tellurium resistance membrane protein TerC